jgi:hypothetical protein
LPAILLFEQEIFLGHTMKKTYSKPLLVKEQKLSSITAEPVSSKGNNNLP